MKPWGWEFRCLAGLALALVAGANPFCSTAATAQITPNSCSATPCSIDVTDAFRFFDAGLAELKSTNNQKLDSGVQAMKDANKSNDRGCYPASASITIFAQDRDPELEKLIGKGRTESLTAYLKGKGLTKGTDFDISTILGQGDKVDVRFNGIDRNPPILKTNSKPPKGTKVKGGDQIKVHATASERFVDGHKSSPTGVKAIQLIADGTVVDSKDYGMKPPPCEVRIFEPSYTVPSNPPPVVHLLVIAEDAVGHRIFEEADFPTADWYGTLKGHGQGNIYNDTAEVRFSFSESADHTIKGRAHVTVTSELQSFGDCVTSRTPPKPYDIEIGGQRVDDEFHLELSNPRKAVTFSSKCRTQSGSFSNETSGFLGAGSQSFLQPKVAAKDGATNLLPQTPGFWHVDATIELHQAVQQ